MEPPLSTLLNGFSKLTLQSSHKCSPCTFKRKEFSVSSCRAFSTSHHHNSWLLPKSGTAVKTRKGRPRVPTGGSTRGTTVVWGDYGLRMVDHHRRVSAAQLKNGEETIRKRLRGLKYRFYTRVCCNIGVFTSGNEVRMGKGKGSFDYWACRVANNRIIFEMKGELHEQVARDAFRLAANKLPGQYEFVKKGDPAVMGLTKVDAGITAADVQRPQTDLPIETKAESHSSAQSII